MDAKYRIKIKQDEFEIEVESHDKSFVDEKLKEYISEIKVEKPIKKQQSAPTEESPLKKILSLPEFVKKVDTKTGPQKVLAIAYYLEKFTGQKNITSKDIASGFKTIKYKHSNPSEAVAKAKTQPNCYLMDDRDQKGAFIVTDSGEKWIVERLKDDTTD